MRAHTHTYIHMACTNVNHFVIGIHSNYRGCFKNSFTTVFQILLWRVLGKCLHLKVYKLSIVQHLSTPLTITTPGKTWCVLLQYDTSKQCTVL
jgi:hypothetical protein